MIKLIKYPNHFKGVEIVLDLYYFKVKIKLLAHRIYSRR